MAAKKFIICLNDTTDEQDIKFIEFIKANGLGWWHWLTNTWLLTDRMNGFTADTLRDQVRMYFPGVNCMVFELRDDNNNWAGFGPNTSDRNMFQWLHDNWNINQ